MSAQDMVSKTILILAVRVQLFWDFKKKFFYAFGNGNLVVVKRKEVASSF